MKKLIRLFVMTQIRHTEEYVQAGLKSQGIDISKLTHKEIAMWKSLMKQQEADAMIYISKSAEFEEIDLNTYVGLVPKH